MLPTTTTQNTGLQLASQSEIERQNRALVAACKAHISQDNPNQIQTIAPPKMREYALTVQRTALAGEAVTPRNLGLQPIRRIVAQSDAAKSACLAAISAALTKAAAFCFRAEKGSENLQNVALLSEYIAEKYGDLCPNEIEYIFHWAIEEKAKPNSTAKFDAWGALSMDFIVQLFAAYTLNRKRFLAAYNEALQSEEREKIKAEKAQAAYIAALEKEAQEYPALMLKNHRYKTWSDCPHWAAKYLVEQGIIRVEAQRQQELIALAKRYAAHEIIGLESRVKVRALWRQFFAARGIEPAVWNIKSLPYSELDYSSKTEPTMQEAEALFLSTWKRHCAALFYFEKLAPYTVEDSVMQAFKKQVENSLLLLEISAKEAGRTAGQIAAAKQMLIEQMERSAGLKYNV